MLTRETLQPLPAPVLWNFVEWLAFGHGRYVGIHIRPREFAGEPGARTRALVEEVARSVKVPDDAALDVAPLKWDVDGDDADLVAAVARYVADRHVALHKEA